MIIFKFIFIVTLLLCAEGVQSQCWDKVILGTHHSFALKTDGTLWAWGTNSFAQLGDGSFFSKLIPTQIVDSNWKTVSSLSSHTLAIKTNGTLWAWGTNNSGQFGNGTTNYSTIPIQIGFESNWVSVSASMYHSLGLKSDGTLWSWGSSNYGQLGHGNTMAQYIPTQIGSANNWVYITTGLDNSFAIKSDGTLWGWGRNDFGKLGDGTIINKLVPTQIGTLGGWQSVSCGAQYSVAIKTDHSMWSWGRNEFGQLGDATTVDKLTPNQIGISGIWVSAKCGMLNNLAQTTDGLLWAWGENSEGQLGDGTNINKLIPTQIGNSNNWISFGCGFGFSAGIKYDGSLLTWGDNHYNQLGDGTLIDKNIPVIINSGDSGSSNVLNTVICSNQLPFYWNSQFISNSGTYTQFLTNMAGCDSTLTLILTVVFSDTNSSNISVCPQQLPYLWNGQSISSSGIYTYSSINVNGCDSTQILNLNVTPISSSSSNLVVCPLQLPYNWNGQILSSSGFYTYSSINANGCDSVSSINLIVDSILNTNLNVSVCADQIPYLWNGQNLDSTGIYSFTTTNIYGCDSLSNLNFFVKSIDYDSTNISICMNQLPYNWNGQSFSNAGVYTHSLLNSAGCDSILTLDLSIINFNATISQLGNSMWSNAVGADYQWINCNTNSIIWGATNQGYTTVIAGDYAVISTIFGCTDTSDCISIYSVNTSEVLLSNEIKIFPNPTSGIFNFISNTNFEDASIEVTNFLGETIIKKENLSGNTFKFDLSSFANGVYVVEVIEKNKSIRTKILKE